MASLAFKIMAFSIFLNLSVGLFAYIGTGGGELSSSWSTQGAQYDSEYEQPLADELESELASPPVEGSDSFGEKILDFFSLGLYTKIKNFLKSTVYGAATFFLNVGLINQAIYKMILGVLTTIYLAAMFEIFTGKTIWGTK